MLLLRIKKFCVGLLMVTTIVKNCMLHDPLPCELQLYTVQDHLLIGL